MAFADPQKNIEPLMIGEDMKVADIGAGSGAYSFAAARVARGGKVYAIDVQKDLLARLKAEASRQHLNNIETIWADIDEIKGTRLMDGALDRAIVSNAFFQFEHKENAAKEIARIVRQKGRILIIDWRDSYGGLGPQAKDVISPSKLKNIFEKENCKILNEFDAGDHHYGIILEKQ